MMSTTLRGGCLISTPHCLLKWIEFSSNSTLGAFDAVTPGSAEKHVLVAGY